MILSESNRVYASVLRIAAVIIISLSVISVLDERFSNIYSFISGNDDYTYLADLLLKATIITVISSLCADICVDNGCNSIAKAVIFGGRTGIVLLSYPLLEAVIKTAVSFAGG